MSGTNGIPGAAIVSPFYRGPASPCVPLPPKVPPAIKALIAALASKANLVDGKVPANELPSYIDDVIEVPNYASLPAQGRSGTIYVTLDTGKYYRWSGTTYVWIGMGTQDVVTSVNGMTGNVTLRASDVGALPSTATATDIGALPAGTTAVDIGGLPANTTAADIGALPANTTAADIGALPANTTAADIGALPANTTATDIGALPSTATAADVGALPVGTTAVDIGGLPADATATDIGALPVGTTATDIGGLSSDTTPADIGAVPANAVVDPNIADATGQVADAFATRLTFGNVRSSIGIPAFMTDTTYVPGRKVVHDGAVWECTSEIFTAGEWTGTENWRKLFNLAVDGTPTDGSENLLVSGTVKTAIDGVVALTEAAEAKITTINSKIPSEASAQNQLADKDFVNSSVATNTATFRETYNLVSTLELTVADKDDYTTVGSALQDYLDAHSVVQENNDYCFVQIPTDDETPTEIARVDRYKCVVTVDGGAGVTTTSWRFEYSLNNSGFTAGQWAALNSGITSGLVTKLDGVAAGAEVNTIQTVKVNGAPLTPDPTDRSVNVEFTIPSTPGEIGALPASSVIEPSTTAGDIGKAADAYYTGTALSNKVGTTGDWEMTGHLTVAKLTVGTRVSDQTVGASSFTAGTGNIAKGDHSIATGANALANVNGSHAEGANVTANGLYSHAEGSGTKTENTAEHAQGCLNMSHKASSTMGDPGNTLWSIGIGTSSSDRKNAIETMQDGKTFIHGLSGYDGTNPDANALDLVSTIERTISSVPRTFTIPPGTQLDNASHTTMYFRPRFFGMADGDRLKSITFRTRSAGMTASATVYARVKRYSDGATLGFSNACSWPNTALTDVTLTFDKALVLPFKDNYYVLEFVTAASASAGTQTTGLRTHLYAQAHEDCYFGTVNTCAPVATVRFYGSADFDVLKPIMYQVSSGVPVAPDIDRGTKLSQVATKNFAYNMVYDAMGLLERALPYGLQAWVEPLSPNNRAYGYHIIYFKPRAFGMTNNSALLSVTVRSHTNRLDVLPENPVYLKLVDPTNSSVKAVSQPVCMFDMNTDYTFVFDTEFVFADVTKEYRLIFYQDTADGAAYQDVGLALNTSSQSPDLHFGASDAATWRPVMKASWYSKTVTPVEPVRYALGAAQTISSASTDTSVTPSVTYGTATLADRTANRVVVTAAVSELRVTLPPAVDGKVRDFELRVEVGTGSAALAAPTLVKVNPSGETVTLENADGEMPVLEDGTASAKGVTMVYFSETASGKMLVKGEPLVSLT